jgi:hypothetical protein
MVGCDPFVVTKFTTKEHVHRTHTLHDYPIKLRGMQERCCDLSSTEPSYILALEKVIEIFGCERLVVSCEATRFEPLRGKVRVSHFFFKKPSACSTPKHSFSSV